MAAKSAQKKKVTVKTRPGAKEAHSAHPRSLTAQAKALRARLKGPVLITAGEHSGDLLAGDLVHAWKRPGGPTFFGTGGDSLRRQGVELIEDVNRMTVVGFIEIPRAYPRLKRLARRLVALAQEKGTRTAVLVDAPGFNLRLAEMLKQAIPDIFIIYLVSPQIWAWKYGRIRTIRKNVDLMLTLFEFEKAIYDQEGVPAEWIGHPLINRIPLELKHQAPVPQHRGPTLALLPGSRRSEVSHLLPDMLEAARLLKKDLPKLRILIPFVDEALKEHAMPFLEGAADMDVRVSTGNSLAVLDRADLVFIASGTATLEAAFLHRPMVICYRTRWLNFLIGAAVVRTKFVGLPNLLAGEQVALELLQTEVTPQAIYAEGHRLLQKKERDLAVARLGAIPFAPKKKRPALLAVESAERALATRG